MLHYNNQEEGALLSSKHTSQKAAVRDVLWQHRRAMQLVTRDGIFPSAEKIGSGGALQHRQCILVWVIRLLIPDVVSPIVQTSKHHLP